MKKYQNIYYLDLDSGDLSFFKQAIEDLGHKVSIYNNGNSMIYDLSIIPTKPDILFLDNRIPILDELEFIQIIKNNMEWNKISLVIVSNVLQKKLIHQYTELGVDLVMKRPTRSKFIEAHRQVLQMDFSAHSTMRRILDNIIPKNKQKYHYQELPLFL